MSVIMVIGITIIITAALLFLYTYTHSYYARAINSKLQEYINSAGDNYSSVYSEVGHLAKKASRVTDVCATRANDAVNDSMSNVDDKTADIDISVLKACLRFGEATNRNMNQLFNETKQELDTIFFR